MGILSAFFVSQRVTGTLGRLASGTFSVGEGAFCCPLRSHFSHALLFCSRPRFFFGLRGQRQYWRACIDASRRKKGPDCDGTTTSERCSGNAPKVSVKPPRRNSPLTPLRGLSFLCPKGEVLFVFFPGLFLETFQTILAFFQSSIRLSFFFVKGFW